jgi:hypothetical protein
MEVMFKARLEFDSESDSFDDHTSIVFNTYVYVWNED